MEADGASAALHTSARGGTAGRADARIDTRKASGGGVGDTEGAGLEATNIGAHIGVDARNGERVGALDVDLHTDTSLAGGVAADDVVTGAAVLTAIAERAGGVQAAGADLSCEPSRVGEEVLAAGIGIAAVLRCSDAGGAGGREDTGLAGVALDVVARIADTHAVDRGTLGGISAGLAVVWLDASAGGRS